MNLNAKSMEQNTDVSVKIFLVGQNYFLLDFLREDPA